MDLPSPAASATAERLQDRSATIGVIGLGYVGLPLCCAASRAGFRVIGFDVDPAKIEAIAAGRSYLAHIPSETVRVFVESGRLSATTDFENLAGTDAILICVPTPLTAQREPDLTFVVSTAEEIKARLRPGQLVVLESTTWPGTTAEVIKPILERSGLKSGADFFLAFSPEREDPGNRNFGTSDIPKVVGGDGEDALRLATALYSGIVAKVVPVSSTQTAEAVKLTENIFRAVNIALANELKVVFSAMGVDIWEVIEAARTKPFGYMPFYPGPGLGGHCIPIDPFYLTWKAREFDLSTRFIELAGEINSFMPHYVVQKLAEALDARFGKGLKGTRLLLLGLAYKKNVADVRESPSLKLMELLEKRGAIIDYYDPHVPVIPKTREHGSLAGRSSIPWDVATFRNYAAILIVTDHDSVDYKGLVEHSALVVDTRNVCARTGSTGPNVVKV